ncbi:SDR family NAD(P)-dependent oxidoreductase [Halopseudomonas maritima]|uniref:SDR family NAD(P)-dependent oxidoreductase n=1 Tax=Halopseudomonas maritima TaxID=2918528 RepID=UPI001EEAD9D8|nr:SDR family oxidoreductase [Halopseudomonas maritima]UJJ31539.1 SDR family oxidoreductase [Halopseudomonas maritima]
MTQVAMVTGASRGIGRATALAFAQAGFDLVLAGRLHGASRDNTHQLLDNQGNPLPGSLDEVAAQVRQLGRQVWCVPMDLLDGDSAAAAATEALAQAGRVDVLVNNAVYQGSDLNVSLMQLQVETLQRVAQAYLISPLLLTRVLAAHMAERGSGVVINVSSGAGESNPPVAAAQGGWGYAYGAGKAAVSRLSGVIKAELGGQGVRAYTLNPGVVTTEALQATIGAAGIAALGVGSAPPSLPAAVMLWLVQQDEAGRWQKRTVHAQPFAEEQGIDQFNRI